MKLLTKQIMIGTVLMVCLNLSAQVVLNNSVNPAIGSRTLFINIDSSFYQPGVSGKNCRWDFSKIVRRDSTYLYYVDAKQTPYHEYFNFANVAMTTDYQIFDYFKFNTTGYFAFGSMGYEASEGKPKYSHLLHEEPMLQFPLQLDDSFSSENMRISEHLGPYTNYQSIHTNIKADAFGTLILGSDTFYNTIRINEKTIYNDSFDDGQRFILSKQLQNKYQWFTNGIEAPLLSLDQTIRVFRGDSTVFVNNSMVGIEPSKDFKNPFSDYLVFNKELNQYEIHLEVPNDQKLSVSIHCQGCLKDKKPSKGYNKTAKHKHVFDARKGNNVLTLLATDVKKDFMFGEPIELIIEGDALFKVLYLLIP